MLAVTFGIMLGPYVAGIFDPRSWGGEASFDEVTLEITRIIVALDVFSVGVELPAAYILHHWRTMIFLLGPVMLAGWFITGAFILIFVPALSYLEALAIAACICPTDVLLASSVVGKGKYAKDHVPAHLRHMLQAEAGANDGIAILLLYLTLFILLRKDYSVAHAIGSWVCLRFLAFIVLKIYLTFNASNRGLLQHQ
jgi:NhaP-type Na+/H+ or K+/H+ antiporter